MTSSSENHQILLRLPRTLFDDALRESAYETLERNERVTVQALIKEALVAFLEHRVSRREGAEEDGRAS